MQSIQLLTILEQVKAGHLSPAEALEKIAATPFELSKEINLDHNRELRCGVAETVFAQGKSAKQVADACFGLAQSHEQVLATRATADQAQAVKEKLPAAEWLATAKCILWQKSAPKLLAKTVAIISAGTSDQTVAAEAKVTLEVLGINAHMINDVGVAGIHRLLERLDEIRAADALIVCAGMEGALPSVVAGLCANPIIAVPTSIGYGASFEGVAALLAMLNSCSPGIGVVNIDNGFGAAVLAKRILS